MLNDKTNLSVLDIFKIEDADMKRKRPYVQALLGEDLDSRARWIYENMDCFGDYDVENDNCQKCYLREGCDQYAQKHGL